MRIPFEWKQGEHMTILGRTGSGKTTLASTLLRAKPYVLSVRTKSDRHESLPGRTVSTSKKWEGFDTNAHTTSRTILTPNYVQFQQRAEIARALRRIWEEGGWTLYLDELFYLDDRLKLGSQIDSLLTGGRGKGITVVCGMQRPVRATRFAMTQSTHLISFAQERRDVRQYLSPISEAWGAAIEGLGPHEFAWYYLPTHAVWTGDVQALQR